VTITKDDSVLAQAANMRRYDASVFNTRREHLADVGDRTLSTAERDGTKTFIRSGKGLMTSFSPPTRRRARSPCGLERRPMPGGTFPLGWMRLYGEGRVLVLLRGHDGRSVQSFASQQLALNGVDWATAPRSCKA
jgi:hypothetical protein